MFEFKREVLNIGAYNEGGFLAQAKEMYEQYLQMNKNSQEKWKQQRCFIRKDITEGLTGNSFQWLVIERLIEHHFNEIKCVYREWENANAYSDVMIATDELFKPKDQYDFITSLKELQDSFKGV